MESIIDTRLKASVCLHGVLHDFREGRGMGKAILELKMMQDLDSVDQDSLFLVFLDPKKAYDNVYSGRLLKTLDGYGAVPNMCILF